MISQPSFRSKKVDVVQEGNKRQAVLCKGQGSGISCEIESGLGPGLTVRVRISLSSAVITALPLEDGSVGG